MTRRKKQPKEPTPAELADARLAGAAFFLTVVNPKNTGPRGDTDIDAAASAIERLRAASACTGVPFPPDVLEAICSLAGLAAEMSEFFDSLDDQDEELERLRKRVKFYERAGAWLQRKGRAVEELDDL